MEERHVKDTVNGVPHTPWVWVPKELRKPDDVNETLETLESSESTERSSLQRQRSRTLSHSRTHPHSHGSSTTYDMSRPVHTPYQIYSSSSPMPPQVPPKEDRSAPRHSPSRPRSRSREQRRDASVGQPGPATHAGRPEPVIPVAPTDDAPHSYTSASERRYDEDRRRTQDRSLPNGWTYSSPPAIYSNSQSTSPRYESHTSASRASASLPAVTSSASAAAAAMASSSRSSTRTPAPAPPQPAPALSREEEAFSSRQALHTTFSTNIVRTPSHYQPSIHSTPTRSMSYDDARRTPSRPPPSPNNHGPIYAPATTTTTPTRSNSLSRSNSLNNQRSSTLPSPATTSSSSSTTPTGSIIPPGETVLPHLNAFSDEPTGLLSPLIVSATPSGSNNLRELSRSQTYPFITSQPTFESIPEDSAAVIPPQPSPYPEQRRISPRNGTISTSAGTSAGGDNRSTSTTAHAKPRTSPQSQFMTERQISRSHTYPNMDPSGTTRPSPHPSPNSSKPGGPSPSRGLPHNPLPPPPIPSAYPTPSVSSSASATASSAMLVSSSSAHHQSQVQPQMQQQPQQQSQQRQYQYQHQHQPQQHQSPHQHEHQPGYQPVRRGYWNRRGDHLIVENNRQYIVYAPRDRANPSELAKYPRPLDGFRDHYGKVVKYEPSIQELPDSLPSHGEPPRRPYDSVRILPRYLLLLIVTNGIFSR